MSGRRVLVLAVLILGVIFLYPFEKNVYEDGGTKEYIGLTYKVVEWNHVMGGKTGITEIYLFPKNFRSTWTYEDGDAVFAFPTGK